MVYRYCPYRIFDSGHEIPHHLSHQQTHLQMDYYQIRHEHYRGLYQIVFFRSFLDGTTTLEFGYFSFNKRGIADMIPQSPIP